MAAITPWRAVSVNPDFSRCHNVALSGFLRRRNELGWPQIPPCGPIKRSNSMKRIVVLAGLAVILGFAPTASAQTLKTVKDRGSLICGVTQGLPGFSAPDDKGTWAGLDVDFCRAV